MPKIIISQGNPLSLRVEFIQSFLDDLNSEFKEKGIEVELNEVQQEYGFTFWEVLRVYLNDIPKELQDFVVLKILEHGTKWANKRFKKVWHRPKSITVYGSKNEILGEKNFPAKDKKEMIDEWEYFYKILYKTKIQNETLENLPYYSLFEIPPTTEYIEAEIKKMTGLHDVPNSSIEIESIEQITKEQYVLNIDKMK
jgi:hypothetical protein